MSTRIARSFLRRIGGLGEAERRAVLLAATSDTGDLALLERAAARLGIELASLSGAEAAGLVWMREGAVEFRHPLARSAIYADAPAAARRETHRALAAALPDRDVDRRAWHLAAAATGIDSLAADALEQAGTRARDRSAYASAAAAFERAGRLTAGSVDRTRRLCAAAECSWHAGLAQRAIALLDEARASTDDPDTLLEIDELAGHIATLRGPVMRGYAILTAAAERAAGERAVAMFAEAASACFYAGKPTEMLAVAERAWSALPPDASVRTRFLATTAVGMARIVGGDAAAGTDAVQLAIALAERAPELGDDVRLLPWLAVAPIFLREAATGRGLLGQALDAARARAALGALPVVLNLIARDQSTSDRLAVAAATYGEAIELARETGQRTELAFGLAGLAWLQARRGRQQECRACAADTLALSPELGTRLMEVWATAALGELELSLGETAQAVARFEQQRSLLAELQLTDPDLSPAPELVDAYTRLGATASGTAARCRFHGQRRGEGAAVVAGTGATVPGPGGQRSDLRDALRAGARAPRRNPGFVRGGAHAAGLRRAPAPSAQPSAGT